MLQAHIYLLFLFERDLSERLKGPCELEIKSISKQELKVFSVISHPPAIQTPANFLQFLKLYKNFTRTFSYFKDVFSSYSYKQEVKPTGQRQKANDGKDHGKPTKPATTKIPISLSNHFVIATIASILPNLQSVNSAVLNTCIQKVFHR